MVDVVQQRQPLLAIQEGDAIRVDHDLILYLIQGIVQLFAGLGNCIIILVVEDILLLECGIAAFRQGAAGHGDTVAEPMGRIVFPLCHIHGRHRHFQCDGLVPQVRVIVNRLRDRKFNFSVLCNLGGHRCAIGRSRPAGFFFIALEFHIPGEEIALLERQSFQLHTLGQVFGDGNRAGAEPGKCFQFSFQVVLLLRGQILAILQGIRQGPAVLCPHRIQDQLPVQGQGITIFLNADALFLIAVPQLRLNAPSRIRVIVQHRIAGDQICPIPGRVAVPEHRRIRGGIGKLIIGIVQATQRGAIFNAIFITEIIGQLNINRCHIIDVDSRRNALHLGLLIFQLVGLIRAAKKIPQHSAGQICIVLVEFYRPCNGVIRMPFSGF